MSYAIDPNDKRPFCIKCNKHVSPQIGVVNKSGPSLLLAGPGQVDSIIRNQAQFTRKFCLECGDPLAEIEFCPQCNQKVPVKIGEKFVGLARGGYQETRDCMKCGKRLAGPSCFIATAAFGTALAPEVETLQEFRDSMLLRWPIGRMFVAGYYSISPPIVTLVARVPSLAAIIRALLRPFVNYLRRTHIAHRRS